MLCFRMEERMKMKRNRNYWLAWIMCMVCTVLAIMAYPSLQTVKLYFMSDINVSMWLWVAWLFDDMNAT